MKPTTLEIDDSIEIFGPSAPLGLYPVEDYPRPAAEPSVAEPSVAEPSIAEPSVAEPSVAETSVAETSVAETSVAETSVAETSVAEAPALESPEMEPSIVDARPMEPLPIGAEKAEATGVPATETGATGFVALSKFEIANGMIEEVRSAFRNRPHLVDGAPGFLRMDVISPVEAPAEIWLITHWTDEASYRSWHRSHVYRESHGGIPKGLKLRPQGTELRYFDHVCS